MLACLVVLLVAGCKKSSQPSYTASVNVSGLVGTGLVLQLNESEKLIITANGPAKFLTQLFNTGLYTVSVLSQPGNPAQVCTVGSNASGTITDSSVTVDVTCPAVELAYLVSGGADQVAPLNINASTGALTGPVQIVSTGSQPVQFALSPSGRYAYTANYAGNSVSAFLANSSNGILASASADVPTGSSASQQTGPVDLVVDNSSQFLYVANATTNNVAGFAINTVAASSNVGALTCVAGTACSATVTATVNSPASLSVSASGGTQYLLVADSADNLIDVFSIDSSSGILTAKPAAMTGNGPAVVLGAPSTAASPFATYVYVVNKLDGTLAVYNNANGTLTQIGTAQATGGTSPNAMALSTTSAGTFAYVLNHGSADVTAFSVSSGGALTSLGRVPTGGGSNPVSISVDPAGAFAYVVNQDTNSVTTFTIAADGTLGATPVTVNMGSSPSAMVTAARH